MTVRLCPDWTQNTQKEVRIVKRIILIILSLTLLLCLSGCKSSDYKDACLLQESGAYQAALDIFEGLGSYKDSAERAQLCANILTYQEAAALQGAEEYKEAAELFGEIAGYEDAAARGELCRAWAEALEAYNAAYAELSKSNASLEEDISTGEATANASLPVMDGALYDALAEAISTAKNAFVPLEEWGETPEATLAAARAMAGVDYSGMTQAILDVCAQIESSNQLYALVDAPSDERVIVCLSQVEGILQCVAVTEETDSNNNLNKAGSYIGRIIFAYEPVTRSAISDSALLNKGTDAGGSIEVFRNQADAVKRDSYLAVFDGTILDSGSHVVVGTVVVRTSSKLTASQQQELQTAITQALLTP